MPSIATKILFFCTAADRRMQLYRLLLVCIIGVLTYSNTFTMPFIFDDARNIVNNPVVREFSLNGLKKAFYSRRAVADISFQLNYFLSGEKVIGYHLTNLIIHLATAVMSYVMVALLMATPYWRDNSPGKCHNLPIPFFVALIFAVHPVQTQAVTYIVQRHASLATLFYITTAVCYLRARLSWQKQSASCLWFMAAGVSAFLAFYTKEIAYTLPIIILMVELLFLRFSVRKLVTLASILVITVLALLLKLGLGKIQLEQVISAVDEATRVQTITSRSDYLFTQFKVIVIYIRLLFFPVNQSVEYDIPLAHSFFEVKVACSFLFLLTLFAFSFWLIQRSKEGNVHLRLTAFGILWFFMTLAVESSFLPIIDLIFEHRVYLPSCGAITAIVTTVLCLFWKSENNKKVVCICLLLITFVFAGVAWKRNFVWADEVTLWEDATLKKPKNARAWNNLGGAYIKQKESVKALHALIRSIELDPSKAAAWNNLGIAIDLMGVYRDRFYKTKEMFVDPKQIENKVVDRWLGDVNNNLGLAYEIVGNLPKAAENYRNAIGYYPALGIAYFNLGLVSAAMGDYDKYVEQQQILWLVDPVLAGRLQNRIGSK